MLGFSLFVLGVFIYTNYQEVLPGEVAIEYHRKAGWYDEKYEVCEAGNYRGVHNFTNVTLPLERQRGAIDVIQTYNTSRVPLTRQYMEFVRHIYELQDHGMIGIRGNFEYTIQRPLETLDDYPVRLWTCVSAYLQYTASQFTEHMIIETGLGHAIPGHKVLNECEEGVGTNIQRININGWFYYEN